MIRGGTQRLRLARACVTASAAVALVMLAGCGMHDLVLRVDLLSFSPELQSAFVLPPVPAAPGGLATGELTLVDDETVNLVEGLSDAVSPREVSLRLRSIADATSGSGTDTLRVYMSDSGTAPRSTPPVLTQVLAFAAGVPDTVTSDIGQDPRLTALFTQKQLRLSITRSARGPSSGAPLAGRITIIQFDAVVVAGRKL